ncbi:hypothetical protein [Seonamhaeicola sp.]|uniref:hypothetical protein n=1 Tax=Seonamhaeicola sp. TaxID=1912245 RepID=UPI00260AE9CC|nr:hypothetical protein [Seonamhaeicola sp.]
MQTPLKKWLLKGVLSICTISCTTAIIDEGTVDDLPVITRVVTYQSDIQSIMTNNCITCHSGPAPNANLDLSNFQNVRLTAENGVLIDRMNDAINPMPPSGILSPKIRQLVDKWAKDGFPEN